MTIENLRCPAMIEAGIKDASSKEGIDFCVGLCPYEKGCILFEPYTRHDKTRVRADFARRLSQHGVSRNDILLIMHCCKRTLDRYLKE